MEELLEHEFASLSKVVAQLEKEVQSAETDLRRLRQTKQQLEVRRCCNPMGDEVGWMCALTRRLLLCLVCVYRRISMTSVWRCSWTPSVCDCAMAWQNPLLHRCRGASVRLGLPYPGWGRAVMGCHRGFSDGGAVVCVRVRVRVSDVCNGTKSKQSNERMDPPPSTEHGAWPSQSKKNLIL